MTPSSPAPLPLEHLGVIAVRGSDARKFLQGQLSQDVLGLAEGRVEWAGLHNPQGRVLALLRLVPDGATDVLCVLPRELIGETVALLRKFLLRAKATLADETTGWQVSGMADDDSLPASPGSARRDGARILWRHAADGRVLCLAPRTIPLEGAAAGVAVSAHAPLVADPDALNAWQRADVTAGLPEISLATRGEFVAQMLNLDALGGISFNKGCYTGQEVIERAHYRGRVKRRAQHFVLPSAAPLAAGESVMLADGRSATVVLEAASAAGRRDVLAVTQMIEGDTLALPLSYPLPD